VNDVNKQLDSLDQQFWKALESLDWQVREKNRLSWFDNRTAQMKGVLANLSAQHIDTSQAEAIFDQFQAQRDPLKAAYENHDQQNLDTLIGQLNALSKQFYDLTHGDALWQARETKRLAEFDNTTTRMKNEIANLSVQGIDVSQAKAILDQIVAERAPLKAAYDTHDSASLNNVNDKLKSLDKQFRDSLQTVSGWENREKNRLAEFDKHVASFQSTLANLKAHGVDVSAGEGLLDQISAERTPLQTAFENHDQTALTSIDQQLKTLESQLQTLIKGYENPLSRKTSSTNTTTTRPVPARTGSVGGVV